MRQGNVTLTVKNFRAIGKAEIKLDGITVVAGVNGCGKSTLSKLLYISYKLSTNFEEYLLKVMENNLEIYKKVERHLFQSLNFAKLKSQREALNLLINTHQYDIESLINKLKKLKEIIKNDGMVNDILVSPFKISRFLDICVQNLSNIDIEIEFYLNRIKHTDNWLDIIDFMIFYVMFMDTKYREDLIRQPTNYLYDEIKKVFHVNYLPEILDIYEGNTVLLFSENADLPISFEIENVIYIDTPMSFNHSEEEHWQYVNKKLKQRHKLNTQPQPIQEIDNLMKNQIFKDGAEVKFDELSESFTFRLKNGVELDLGDIATGMKTFAMLDRLVKNGSINKKTLLILDEPEAHLHPQWVVEFGRFLTLINKHIGAKVFVATHSPDMVQALRYIPNKEGTGENVNFYLAEYNDESHLFDYQDLNGKIGKIFTSFNVSMDKLEQYGEE